MSLRPSPRLDSPRGPWPKLPSLARRVAHLSLSLIVVSVICCTVCCYDESYWRISPLSGVLSQVEAFGAAVAAESELHAAAQPESLASLPWPDGTQVLRFEDLEGAILVRGRLVSASGLDTSGVFVLDTGAGFLALDLALARRFGVTDSASTVDAVDLAAHPLARLELGRLRMDQVSPVLTVDAGVVRRVTGRPVLGLLGQAILRERVVVLDYREGTLALPPPEADPARASPVAGLALSAAAVAVPFGLAGDGKVLVSAWVTDRAGRPPGKVRLIVDTGATKSVLFRRALDGRFPGWRNWPALRGLGAPTLTGDENAELVRVPRIELRSSKGKAVRLGMDAAVLDGGLGQALADDVGEPVDGLLGYSFLKHYRIALDFPRSLLWLDPSRGDVEDRLEEYCHPGLQLESASGTVMIFAVAEGSPAARAGIRAGDELVAIDGESVSALEVVAVSRRLEGAPGTTLLLRLRRGSKTWDCRVARTRLL